MLAEVVRRASGATTTTWPIAISASEGRKPMKVKYMSAASPKASMGRISGDMKNRSEEHTSELQSQSNLVCRLLLEKKHNQDPALGGDLARLLVGGNGVGLHVAAPGIGLLRRLGRHRRLRSVG